MGTYLDRAKRHQLARTAEDACPGLAFNLRRLRQGLEWMLQAWTTNPLPWPEDLRRRFAFSLDLWILLEEMTRKIYSWDGCPMEPDGCDPEGPVVCDVCISSVEPAPPAGQQQMFNLTSRH